MLTPACTLLALPAPALTLPTGGEVINVLFSALIGGFALGQAAPNLQYFVQVRGKLVVWGLLCLPGHSALMCHAVPCMPWNYPAAKPTNPLGCRAGERGAASLR